MYSPAPSFCLAYLKLAILAVLLASQVNADVVSTSSTNSNTATASVSNDLLQTSLTSTSWPANNNINNGTTGAFGQDTGTNPGNITLIGTYDFVLDLASNPLGYDISQINAFTGWLDNRAGQNYTVFFSFVGDPSFTQIGPIVDVAASGQSLVTNLLDDTGALLGSGVDVVRFVVDQNGGSNGNVWREIDAIGSPTEIGVESFTADQQPIGTGSPVTLNWEVGPLVTDVVIDQGVGDVTAQTNSNGVGSITIDPGPSDITVYTLSATLPTRVSQDNVVVSVTDQPIINTYNASESFVNPGEAVTLTWDVQNAISLTLNGTDVTGQTSLEVTPTGQSSYILQATNANGVIEREVTVFSLSEGEVIISEFVASNDSSLADEDGDFPDWIEIHNPTSTAANLAGYTLTDDIEDLQQWTFPTTTLQPGARLIVFASNKNRATSGSELHTNFSLSANGEYLALIKPDGVSVATQFSPEYPEQRSDISYGYDLSQQGFRYFQITTPEAVNTGAFTGFVDDTSFSVDRGFFETAFSLEITSDTQGAVIRYTLDGSEPNEDTSLVYSSPIAISETTVVRAAAFREGFLPTNTDTQTYIFPTDVIDQPDMRADVIASNGDQVLAGLSTIPTIAFSFDGTDINRSDIPLSVEFINFEGSSTQINAGARRFGNFVTNFEKRSYRLRFRSEFGASRLDFPLFNHRSYEVPAVDSFNSLDLRSGSHDMVRRGGYLANLYTDEAMTDMGHLSAHSRFVHLYFNGQYRGVYQLRERWDADMASSYLPGSEEEYDTIDANNAGRNFQTGDLQDGDLDDWNQIQANLVNEPRFTQVRDMLDLNNMIDFMLLFLSGTCEAEFRAAGSLVNGEGFKFYLKDADGYLQPDDGDFIPPGGFYPVTHNGPLDSMRLLREEANPDFMSLLADRIHKRMFNDGELTPAKNIARYTTHLEEMRQPYFAEYARWESHDSGRDIARTPAEWEAYHQFFFDVELPTLTGDVVDRLRDANMYPDIEAPTYSQHGGSLSSGELLTVSVPNTVSRIYYMTGPADTNPDIYINSLDPRLPGGAINPAATLIDFGAPVTPVNLIDIGESWRFLDDGSNQGTNWREVGFNDSAWSSGNSPLGYGDPGFATTVSFGPDTNNRFITTYFRKNFNVNNPSGFENMTLRFQRDDGIAIYLNGVEVTRDNLAANAVSSTLATSGIGGASETNFMEVTLNSNLFQTGQNTIAVEVHQNNGSSSDLRFNLELQGNPLDLGSNSTQITLTEPSWVLARSYNETTGEWSALNEAFFTIIRPPANADNLVVSKIHYNPADPTGAEVEASGGADNGNDYEFIELMNVGNEIISLAGVAIAEGINFTFGDSNELAPGGRILVVENRQAFDARYNNILGSIVFASDTSGESEWSGGLSNGGEQLIVTNAEGGIIHDFTYDDVAPWPTAPGGSGYSLVLRNPAAIPDHNNGSNWAASAEIGGSPGGSNAVGFVGDPDEDLDGDGLTALVEYVLGTSDSLGGDSTIATDFQDFEVAGELESYLTISFSLNQHSLNAVSIVAEISSDLEDWDSMDDIVLVSETENEDGNIQVTYRSNTPMAEVPERREFIRLVISEIP